MSTYDLIGKYTNIQRLCSHDGPGLRSTLFLKGCPLHCTWCHNPENIGTAPDIGWNAQKCIGCLSCRDACKTGALATDPDGIHIDKTKCAHCGACTRECPTTALTWYGSTITVQEAVRELLKDRLYYEESGGGVTLSGGEPLMQPIFTREVFAQLHQAGVSTALDTTCFSSWEIINSILPYTHILLIDIKLFDTERHKRMTGVDNTVILENIRKIAQYARENSGVRIFIRTPLVPGCTADEENVCAIGTFIHENLEDVLERWELLLFHNMCRSKYQELSIPWQHEHTPMIKKSQMDALKASALESGVTESKIIVQGLAEE